MTVPVVDPGFAVARSDAALWEDEALLNPFPLYARLREIGAAVWLDRHGLLALPRWSSVHDAAVDWHTFSSAAGIGVDREYNRSVPETTITSDPPRHTQIRKSFREQLSTSRLALDRRAIRRRADDVVDRFVAAGGGDAVASLARPFAKSVLCDIVGIPEHDRPDIDVWSETAFNSYGPANERAVAGSDAMSKLLTHTASLCEPGVFAPGSRGAQLIERGEHARLIEYVVPGIDTVAHGLSSALLLLVRHPEWLTAIREDRTAALAVFNEALRLHTPVQFFTRLTTEPVSIQGISVPSNVQVLLMFGSANRDADHFERPDEFDPERRPAGHLAFGAGIHRCVGAPLASIEAEALLVSLAERVTALSLSAEPAWRLNNVLHGPARLVIRAR